VRWIAKLVEMITSFFVFTALIRVVLLAGLVWVIWNATRKPSLAERQAEREEAYRGKLLRMHEGQACKRLLRPSRPALLTRESRRRARAASTASAAHTAKTLNR